MKMSDFVRQALVSHLAAEGFGMNQIPATAAKAVKEGGQ